MAAAKSRRSRTGGIAGPLSDQPWYVKTVVWVGLPTLLAGYLTYVFVERSGEQQTAQTQAISAQAKSTAELTSQLRESELREIEWRKQISDQLWMMVSATQRNCLNTSKTDADRIACASLTSRPQ